MFNPNPESGRLFSKKFVWLGFFVILFTGIFYYLSEKYLEPKDIENQKNDIEHFDDIEPVKKNDV